MSKKPAKSVVGQVRRLEAELVLAKKKIDQLEAQIETDPLLGILNRRGFQHALDRAIAHVKRYQSAAGIIFLDLNGFKRVNDCHGHVAGDVMLKAVVTAISAKVRKSDVIGRFGGDEFIVLLWNVTRSSLRAKAKTIEKIIAELKIPFGGGILRIEASAGTAMLHVEDEAMHPIERADADMYSRKHNSINQVAVAP
jgi:diguanylate cyclase (GGDEF)-like protein